MDTPNSLKQRKQVARNISCHRSAAVSDIPGSAAGTIARKEAAGCGGRCLLSEISKHTTHLRLRIYPP
jgi:hypothetical protein